MYCLKQILLGDAEYVVFIRPNYVKAHAVCLSVVLSVCPTLAKSCPLINFKLITHR